MNAIGLVLTALPDSFAHQINQRIVDVIKQLANHPTAGNPCGGSANPFNLFNFGQNHQVVGEQHCSYVLSLCHAVWQHASIGQLSVLPQ